MRFSASTLLRTAIVSAALLAAWAAPVMADHVLITRHFTGIWTQPDHESQGMILQIADQADDSKLGVAYWFTYGPDLFSSWYLAVGPVEGHEINMTLYEASGVGFLQEDIEGDLLVAPIGTLTLVFKNCNQGVAIFDTPEELMGSGEFRIRRISSIYRSRCTGGISDDTPHDMRPVKMDVRLHSVRDTIGGEGKAAFQHQPGHSSFKVNAEGLPPEVETLALEVCGQPRGEMSIIEGEGHLDFRSPPVDDKPLLDFDPRGCMVELLDGDGPVLSSGDEVLAEDPHGPPDG